MDRGNGDESSCSPEVEAGEREVPSHRMVKVEMEAAEALADLAQLAVREGGSGSGGKVAGRARKRVKTESSLSHSGLDLVNSVPLRPDLAQDGEVLSLQQHEKPCTTIDLVKYEQCAQPLDPNPLCTASYVSLGGGRARQNLSEAEKEAKRLRRVLANRESARRTIRRRQALCDELTRKAIELSEENEKLKKGKEAALREFHMLETTNRRLKAEMAKASKYEVMDMSKLKHDRREMPASLLNFPMLPPNALFAPCLWPPIFQSQDTIQQCQVSPTIPFVPANVTAQAACKADPPYEQSVLSISGPRNPVYILPCPWVFTLSNQGHHCESSHSAKSVEDEKPVDNQDDAAATSKMAVISDKSEVSGPRNSVKPEEAQGIIRTGLLNDLNEIPVESPVDQYDQQVGLCCEEAGSDPEQPSSSGLEAARDESALCSYPIEKANVSDISVPDITLAEKEVRESVSYSCDTKTVGSTVAAEARKRRKELTKLKAIHGRQCHTRC